MPTSGVPYIHIKLHTVTRRAVEPNWGFWGNLGFVYGYRSHFDAYIWCAIVNEFQSFKGG